MKSFIPVSDLGNDLILHIGPPKTGSSSLQRVLNKRRKQLLDMNICSPDLPAKERNKFALSICKNPSLLHFEPRSIARQKIIISAESMSSAVANESFFELIQYFERESLINTIQVVYVKKSFKRISYSEFNQNCFQASHPSASPTIKSQRIEAIKELISTGNLRRRSQLKVVKNILHKGLNMVVLDLKGNKDVVSLFFFDFLKLNPKSLKLPSVYYNVSQTEEREAQVLGFIEQVLTDITPNNQYESIRLSNALSCLSAENPSFEQLLDILSTESFTKQVNLEEEQFYTLISQGLQNLTIH